MEFEVGSEERAGYLCVCGRGPLEPATPHLGRTRILVDATEGCVPFRGFDPFFSGQLVAELLPRPYKVAIVYLADLINKFAENAAVNRGANLLVCADRALGRTWLLSSLPTH